MKTNPLRKIKIFALVASALLAIWACNLGGEAKTEEVFTFPTLADSLKGSDRALIYLTDPFGEVIDTLFNGPITSATRFENLVARRFDGGKAVVVIEGYKDGAIHYKIQKIYDGARSKVDGTIIVIARPVVPGPGPVTPSLPVSVRITTTNPLILTVGGPSISLTADVLPVDAPQTILWSLPTTDIAVLETGNKIKGLKAGTVQAKASSVTAPEVFSYLDITVNPAPSVLPTSITPKDTALTLTVGAASVLLQASVQPAEASQALIWTLDNPGVAEIVNGTHIRGLKAGTVNAIATSLVKSEVTASIKITVVVSEVEAESISLGMPTPITMAPGGSLSDLIWTVLPAGADQRVEWTSSNINVAQITEDNKVKSFEIGTATLTGRSNSNPTVTKSVQVIVIRPVKVDGIAITPAKMTLYTGGPTGKISVVMVGSDTGGAQYSLATSDAAIATVDVNGMVKGLAMGVASITASVVGYPAITSTCSVTVVKDVPVVTVSPNQNVALNGDATFTVSVAAQAHGATVEIKADMDGDNVFEQTVLNKDSAEFKHTYSEVKATTVSFKVKDTEGNEVVVTRKVTVGAPGSPIVAIVIPSKDTTVNVTAFKIRFTVKDTSQKIDTSIDSIVTLTPGANKITVVRKNAGGNGSDEVIISVDNTAPSVAINGPATQITGTAAISLSGTSSDAESGLLSISVSGALSGNGAATLTGGEWSKGGLTLKEGGNLLVATATDKAGNTKTASITVTLDTKAPDAVSFAGVDGALTADDTPTWSWTPSTVNPGIGSFVLKLDAGAEFDGGTATTFTPTTPISDNATHTLTVKEKDQVPGVTGPAKSFSFKVKVNPPAAPTVKSAVATLPNNGATNNPGFTWMSGGGGNGKFRLKLNTETTYRINGVAVGQWSLAATDPDGTYAVHVSEQDDLGRWGAEGHFTIQLDRTGPVYAQIRIKGSTLNLRDGYITNDSVLTITYTSDGDPKELTCTLSKDNASNACSAVNKDALNNSSTMTRNIWRRSKVVFFKPTASGSMDGSSWENARSDLAAYLDLDNSKGKDLWLASGDYSSQNPNIFFKWDNIYGGFDASKFPTDLNNRMKNNTLIGTLAVFGAETLGTFDGLRFTKGMSGDGALLNIVDCQFLGRISFTEGSKISIKNSELSVLSPDYSSLFVGGAEVTWDGGKISGNVPVNDEEYAININAGGSLTLKGSLTVSGNGNPDMIGCPGCQFLNEGTLNITSPVSVNCGTIVNRGSGSCLGTPLPE